MRGALLEDVSASGARLGGTRLARATLSRANFSSATLQLADLAAAEGEGASFEAADLSEARLVSATLRRGVWAGARFERANLSHADLSHGDFRSAVFRGAILTHASFREADVDEADFRGAREHACLASPTPYTCAQIRAQPPAARDLAALAQRAPLGLAQAQSTRTGRTGRGRSANRTGYTWACFSTSGFEGQARCGERRAGIGTRERPREDDPDDSPKGTGIREKADTNKM